MTCRWVLWALLAAGGCSNPSAPTVASDGPMPYPSAATSLDVELSGCPGEALIASITEVEARFSDAVTRGTLVCAASRGSRDLTGTQRDAYGSLIMMKRLRYSRPLPWTDRTLYEWFTSLVHVVVFDNSGGPPHTGPGYSTVTVELSPELYSPSSLRWDRIGTLIAVLVHEGRHWEGFSHTCADGRRDRTVDEMGAFGVHNLYFVWNGSYADSSVLPAAWRPHELYAACVQRKSGSCSEPQGGRCE